MNILKQFGIKLEKNEKLIGNNLTNTKNKLMKQTKITFSENYSEINEDIQINQDINDRLELHGIKKELCNNEKSSNFYVFIDGSALNNGNKSCRAGYAAIFPNHPHLNISEPLQNDHKNVATNNRAEYMGCIRALEQANIEDPENKLLLTIHTDSKLLMDSMTKWISNWKKNNWKKSDGHSVLNRDLLEQLDKLLSRRKVFWKHVKAHTGGKDYNSIWNDKADEMAKKSLNNNI